MINLWAVAIRLQFWQLGEQDQPRRHAAEVRRPAMSAG
jgi:hypothetical protein